jgi:uncharacterized LabA/DUF88 family protein
MAYATIEEANEYYLGVYNSKWNCLPDLDKETLLENATKDIDSYEYSGRKKEENQLNEFPRVFCDNTESDERLVKKACILQAMFIYENGGSTISASDIKSFKLGDVDVALGSDMTAEATATPIDNVLGRYMRGNSARILL